MKHSFIKRERNPRPEPLAVKVVKLWNGRNRGVVIKHIFEIVELSKSSRCYLTDFLNCPIVEIATLLLNIFFKLLNCENRERCY